MIATARTRLERLCDGWIEAGWLMVLIATPLLFNVASTRVFEPEKSALVRALALVMTAAWVVRWAASGRAWRPLAATGDRGRWLPRTAGLAMAAFLAVHVLATLLSIAPRVSWRGSFDRAQGMATTLAYVAIGALVLATLRSVGQWRRLVYAATAASVPVALYAVVQSLGRDPVPWGTDFGQRVGSTLGNPIFLGGYLAPVAFLTAGELAAVRPGPGSLRRRAVFGLALGLQLTALVLSQSRGPIAGLLAGVFITSLWTLLAVRGSASGRRAGAWRRHGWLLPIGGALLGVALLAAVARGGSALASWRELPGVGRVLSALDPEAKTTRFRAQVWGGMDRLWRSELPIEYPGGDGDRLSALRPLIGYGPETLRLTFPAVASPELAHLEGIQVVPDRAHNEVFDVLATTGLLGLGAFLLLWACVFAGAASALGWLRGGGLSALWWILGGAAAGVAVAAAAGRPMLLGLAIPAGLLLGVTGFSIAAALRDAPPPAPALDRVATIRVVALAGALVAHFVEIQVGIAVTATRSYFWILWAALAVVAAAGLENRPASSPAVDRPRFGWQAPLVAAVLVTLAFDFVAAWATVPYVTWLVAIFVLLAAIGTRLARLPDAAGSRTDGRRRQGFALVLGLGLGLGAILVVGVVVDRACLRPIRADTLFKSGVAYFDQRRFDECLELYGLALAADPGNDRLWMARGHAERLRALSASREDDRDRWLERAAGSLDRAVELHPLLVDHLAYRGRVYAGWSEITRDPAAAAERRRRARRDLELAAARSPGSTELRNLLAELHLRQGERRSAETLFRRSLELDPRSVGTYFSLARMRLEDAASAADPATAGASLQAALELYDRAVAVAPGLSELHAGRGYVLTRLGRPEPAVAAYARAVEIHPGDTTSHLNLALLHRRSGRPRQALEHARKAYGSRDPGERRRAAELVRELGGEAGGRSGRPSL